MNDSFPKLKQFFESSTACEQALQPLKNGVEIGLTLDQSRECALGCKNDTVYFEERPATRVDVIFNIKSDAVDPICASEDDVGKIGITVMKQIKAGNIGISVPGNLFSLLRNGYIEIIKLGGKTIWSYLSEHGVTNPAKIIALIRKMKARSK